MFGGTMAKKKKIEKKSSKKPQGNPAMLKALMKGAC